MTGERITRSIVTVFTPQSLEIDASVTTTKRRRSIYEATIYDADIMLTGGFGALTPPKNPEGNVIPHWDQALLAVKFNSNNALKGVRENLTLKIDGAEKNAAFEPGIILFDSDGDYPGAQRDIAGVSAALPITDPEKGFAFDLSLPMSAAARSIFHRLAKRQSPQYGRIRRTLAFKAHICRTTGILLRKVFLQIGASLISLALCRAHLSQMGISACSIMEKASALSSSPPQVPTKASTARLNTR